MRVERIGDATLYLGDCREVLPTLGPVDAVVTDPVWPNCPPGLLVGSENPDGLFSDLCANLPTCRQMVVCLRSDCDPRMLRHVPRGLRFQQVVWCPYVVPGYTGRTLGGNETAYVFGEPIPSAPGQRVIPSQATKVQPGARPFQQGETRHPCPRSIEHQLWLMRWFSLPRESVLDPFMGSGTAGVAAVLMDRKFVGCEIVPEFFDVACCRIEEAYRQPRLFAEPVAKPVQETLAL